jgi:hypothetical protein
LLLNDRAAEQSRAEQSRAGQGQGYHPLPEASVMMMMTMIIHGGDGATTSTQHVNTAGPTGTFPQSALLRLGCRRIY